MIQEDRPGCTWYQQMLKLVQDKPEDFPDYVCENQQLYRHIGSRPDRTIKTMVAQYIKDKQTTWTNCSLS